MADVDVKQEYIKVYAIYDKKSKRFDTPFFAVSDLFAKRRYLIMMEEPKSPLSLWREDFELYRLSDFNPHDGSMQKDYELVFEGKSVPKKED